MFCFYRKPPLTIVFNARKNKSLQSVVSRFTFKFIVCVYAYSTHLMWMHLVSLGGPSLLNQEMCCSLLGGVYLLEEEVLLSDTAVVAIKRLLQSKLASIAVLAIWPPKLCSQAGLYCSKKKIIHYYHFLSNWHKCRTQPV